MKVFVARLKFSGIFCCFEAAAYFVLQACLELTMYQAGLELGSVFLP